MNPDDDEIGEPVGYIEWGNELMKFWLPDGVDPNDLELNWIEP
jgi:hypothetical protein